MAVATSEYKVRIVCDASEFRAQLDELEERVNELLAKLAIAREATDGDEA
jgi:hypothetical protein